MVAEVTRWLWQLLEKFLGEKFWAALSAQVVAHKTTDRKVPSLDYSCSAAVESTHCNHDVVGSNPAGRWAFFFYFYISFISGVSLIRFLKKVYL